LPRRRPYLRRASAATLCSRRHLPRTEVETMRRILIGLLALAGPWLALAAQRGSSATHDTAGLDEFVRAHVERRETPPFAFDYDGKASSELLARWAITSRGSAEEGKTVKTVVYADQATGLRVEATYTLFPDFPAVEWVVRFKNEDVSDSPILNDVQACSVTFSGLPEGPVTQMTASPEGLRGETVEIIGTDTNRGRVPGSFSKAAGQGASVTLIERSPASTRSIPSWNEERGSWCVTMRSMGSNPLAIMSMAMG
jgi:hypothetical protein